MILQYLVSSMILPAELLLAALVYISRLQHREHFALRLILSGALSLVLPVVPLAPILWVLPEQDGLTISLLYATFSYLTIFGVAYFCCKIPLWEGLYCATCVYLTQHFAHCFRHFFLPQANKEGLNGWPMYVLIYGLVYGAAYFLFARKLPNQGQYRVGRWESVATTIAALAIALVLSSYAQEQQYTSESLYRICLLYAMSCCLLALWTQLVQQKRLALQHELDVQHQLWLQQKAQYEMSAENVELINRKCHDLKYQIAVLEKITDQKQRSESIRSLEQAVMIYDSVVKTGNDILDTVLTEKSLLCEDRGITLTCMADGNCLNFMDAVDIYTIFGNAMDNAIDCVSHLKDPEQRIITVTVFSRADLVFLQLENYWEGEETDGAELPKTSKQGQTGYHGFGLKSIRSTAEKYGGFLTLQNGGGIFLLRVTIPVYRP